MTAWPRCAALLLPLLIASPCLCDSLVRIAGNGFGCVDSHGTNWGSSCAVSGNDDFGFTSGNGFALGDFGVLRASAAVLRSENGLGLEGPIVGSAIAHFGDSFTVGGSARAGFLRFRFLLDGVMSRSTTNDPADMANSVNQIILLHTETGNPIFRADGLNEDILEDLTYDVPYLGPLTDADFTLEAAASCVRETLAGSCATSSDFSGTALVTGLGFLDMNHNFVDTATITALSGFSYPPLTTVPEPATGTLVVTILGAITMGLVRKAR